MPQNMTPSKLQSQVLPFVVRTCFDDSDFGPVILIVQSRRVLLVFVTNDVVMTLFYR